MCPVPTCWEPDEIDNRRNDDAGDIAHWQANKIRCCAAIQSNATDTQEK